MTSEAKPNKVFNMEVFFDVSRRWRRPAQILSMTLSIMLLYLVVNSQVDKPLEERDINVQNVADIPHQLEMRQQQIQEESKQDTINEFRMPDVDNSVGVVPDAPLADPKLCPQMLDDILLGEEGSMPLVALASFPRSGNTWTRLLLQVASQYSTGSVYWETEQKYDFNYKTFRAGTEDFQLRKGICVKTHMYSKEHVELFTDGAILLLRNPYFSLVSEFFRELVFDGNRTNEDTARAILEEPRWKNGYFPNQSGFWRETNLNWIKYCKRLLVVFYEDLEKNPMQELARMLQFLKQPVRIDRLRCSLQLYPPDLNHTYLTFDPYTAEQREHLDGYIAEVNEVLVARNGRPLPKYRYHFQN